MRAFLSLALAAVPAAGFPAGSVAHAAAAHGRGHLETDGHSLLGEHGKREVPKGVLGNFMGIIDNRSKKKDGAMGCMILGCFLWAVCPICIWNNERISVKQAKMRLKAGRHALHIDDIDREPLQEMNGRIVYITGDSRCSATLADEHFPEVKSEGKIKLRRIVEMYQWEETSREEGEDDRRHTVYEYKLGWSDHSQEVSHDPSKRNPPFPMPSTRRQEPYCISALSGSGEDCPAAAHETVRLGAYYLSEYVIRELRAWKDKDDVTESMLASDGKAPRKEADGWWYFGREVGDIRVRFEELHTGPLTVCGVLCHTRKGWSFVPIVKQDAGGTGDSLVAECGQNCGFSVQELHFADPAQDADFLQALEGRKSEVEKVTLDAFARSDTTRITQYDAEEDMSDLCCVGPFGQLVVKLMHWMGIEDELLAVREERSSLRQLLQGEEASMSDKVNGLRTGGFLGLMIGSYCIVAPVLTLLNYNIWVSMLGGAILSCMLCSCAMLCACMSYLCILSTAWIFYRPFLGILGFALAISCFVGVSVLANEGGHRLQASHETSAPYDYAAAFLARH